MNKHLIIYRLAITVIFVYIFIQFLTMKRSNFVYKFYSDYIMHKFCILLYVFLILIIMKYDSYTAILLFILIIIPFKFVYKEYFKNFEYFADLQTINTTIPTISTIPNTSTIPNRSTIPNITFPKFTQYNIQLGTDELTQANLIQSEYLNKDDRFKINDVAKDDILKQIRKQIENDPYKTNLSKNVINEIYAKYFNNDIFKKLIESNDDSKQYIASGNFPYLPKDNKADYDLTKYQNLSNNFQLGINPIVDGIKTINRS